MEILKKIKLNKYIISTYLLALSSCIVHYYNHSLSVYNNSPNAVSIRYTNGTDESENNIAYYISEGAIIKPDSTMDIVKMGNKNVWHEYIQEGKSKRLSIYFFNIDTLKKYDGTYSINELSNMHKYIRKMELTEQHLTNCNWKLFVKGKE